MDILDPNEYMAKANRLFIDGQNQNIILDMWAIWTQLGLWRTKKKKNVDRICEIETDSISIRYKITDESFDHEFGTESWIQYEITDYKFYWRFEMIGLI